MADVRYNSGVEKVMDSPMNMLKSLGIGRKHLAFEVGSSHLAVGSRWIVAVGSGQCGQFAVGSGSWQEKKMSEGYKDLTVYKEAYKAAMEIYDV